MNKKWASAALVTGVMASALVAVPATQASAVVNCTGKYKITWSAKKSPWAITHRKVIENYTGGTVTKTYSVEKIYVLGASATFTAGAKFKQDAVLESMEESFDAQLQMSGSYTNKHAESITYTLSKNDTYVLYSGTHKVTGNWTRYKCEASHWFKTGQYGKAQSWTQEVDGGVRCGATVPKTSLAAAVKKKYC
ncbi:MULTISPECIES: hypothetical protein [unclassified Streptomyces]|uniref:hypothetical protein n=1 Tax=unclassified Streptomyces TaxID=2593676 RepID=UPI00190C6F0D|nr:MULTISPECIES: hypothetical protein [unclassified Streptomyces]MBK3563364.1 hypothetical protein [Streptomyces sp. MBT62]MBK6011521.1 hypothetical protein [Streptomyces sp. MBT53]